MYNGRRQRGLLTKPLEVEVRVARRGLTSPTCSPLLVGVAVPDILKSRRERKRKRWTWRESVSGSGESG